MMLDLIIVQCAEIKGGVMLSNDIHKMELIEHISKTLPDLSNSVNNIVNYISEKKKFDSALLVGLAELRNAFKIYQFDNIDLLDQSTLELHRLYLDGMSEILLGSDKIIILIAQELGVESNNISKIINKYQKDEVSVESVINHLFNGAKMIASVVEKAIED